MDARDRLRRYLEQRRELGESEFVLDGMPVEDVLKLVGAKHGAPARARSSAAGAATRQPGVADVTRAPSGTPEAAVPTLHPEPRIEAAPPPAPEVRFNANASTDWRETLRHAGAGRVPDVSPAVNAGSTAGEQPPPPAGAAAAPHGGGAASGSPDTTSALPAWLAALALPTGLAVSGSVLLPPAGADVSLAWTQLGEQIAACQQCGLHRSAKQPVPGEGHRQAELLCVGEAPGAHEDEQGRPFVGDAGQLLTKILAAIQFSREDVYICNVLKHRPPGNRDPLPDEVQACQPFLMQQIALVRPRVILALGRFAAQTLLQTTTAIGALRGKVHRFHGVPLIVTYHPAALLRNEQWKRPTWEDVKLARRILDASRAASADTVS